MLGEHSFLKFRWAEFIADKCGTIRFVQNGLIDTNWIMSQNQLDLVCKIPLLARRTRPMQPVGQARRATIGYLVYKIRPCCYLQIFPNTAAMHLAERNLQNEWSTNIVAQKEVDLRNFWCSDLWYITSAIIISASNQMHNAYTCKRGRLFE